MTETVHPASLALADDDLCESADWQAGDICGFDVPAVALESVRGATGRVTLHYGWVLHDEAPEGPGIELVRQLGSVRTGDGIVATDAFLDAARPLPHDADPRPLWPFHDTTTGTRVLLHTLLGTDRAKVALPRANFGAFTGPLFGRGDDLEELAELVDAHAVVLLKGPPGIGKTSLARHYGWSWATEHAPAPAWFVDPPPSASSESLVTEVARAVGVLQDLPTDAQDRILHLGRVLANLTPNLLILDGVDEATDDALELATQLTAVSPDTRVLVTSQIAGPRPSALVRELGGLDVASAVRLYLHRRTLRRPDVPIADRDLRAARDAARELVGTPAAIEVVSVAMEEESFPTHGAADAATHRAIIWAGSRLTDPAAELLRNLQVFGGPFDFDHVRSVSSADDVEAQFESLLDLSMVATHVDEEPMFFLPSTVSRWARESLGEPSKQTEARWLDGWQTRARHFVEHAAGPSEIHAVRRYRAFTRQATRALRRAASCGHAGHAWLFCAAFQARLLQLSELDALRPDRCDIESPEAAAHVALAGARIAYFGGRWDEALARLDEAPTGVSVSLDALLEVHRASFEAQRGEEDRARQRCVDLLARLEDVEEPVLARALAHDVIARHYVRRDDLTAAEEAAVEAVNEAMRREHPSTIAALQGTRALVALRTNRLETARHLYTEALRTFSALGRDHPCAIVLGNLAHVDLQLGHLTAAHNGFLQSIDLARRALRPNPEAVSRLGLAWVELRRGDLTAARDELVRSTAELEQLGNEHYAGIARAWLAVVHTLRNEPDEAHDDFARAREHLPDPREETAAILALLETFVDEDAEALAKAFEDFDADGSSARAAAAIVRGILDEADHRPADLLVADDARWFQVADDEPVDISRRSAPRRVLAALTRRHVEDPGRPMSLDELFEIGWPGELATADAAANRVYVTIATLRKLGLRELLLSLGDGYGFDPDRRVRVVD